MSSSRRMQPCPICGEDSYDYGATKALSMCDACEHIYQSDLAPTVNYGEGYGASRYEQHSDSMSFLRAGYILGLVGERPSVLDVGYGNGLFLKTMRKAGSTIAGIDVHGKDYGIPEVNFSASPVFDVLTFFDSLEHFSEFSLLDQVRAKHIFVSIPYLPPEFCANPVSWKHYRPGEHLQYFSSSSLSLLMLRKEYSYVSECSIEDTIRGKCVHLGRTYDNIHTYHFKSMY